jgi:hypothetical protein
MPLKIKSKLEKPKSTLCTPPNAGEDVEQEELTLKKKKGECFVT